MERHHKAAVLSSSSSNPASTAGFSRKPLKRCMCWCTIKVLSLIQLAVIASFIICLLLCLWRLPQDHDAYPDGFSPCPTLSYKILNVNNVTTRCEPCTKCPNGHEPVPPCGTSTVQSEISMECRICPPGSYKEKHGTGRCRPCRTCSLRQTINQCTSERNTQCGECPRGYYQEDFTLDSCKRCSTCCGVKRFAEIECIYLKQCKRTNCTQQMEDDKSHVRELDKVNKTFTTIERISHQRRTTNQSVSQNVDLEGEINWALELVGTVSQSKKRRFRRENNMTIQRVETDKYAMKGVGEETATPKDEDLGLTSPATVDDDHATSLVTTQSKLQDGINIAPDYSVLKPTLTTTLSYLSDFKALLTGLVALVGVAVMVLIFIAVLIACKKESGQLPRRCCTVTCCVRVYLGDGEESLPFKTECDCQESCNAGDNVVYTSQKGPSTGGFESLSLSEMSPDLENKLMLKLDVRHKGEYGWKTLCRAFEIDRDNLKYLETAYIRDVGSPTKELLEILVCQGKTYCDLLNKLEDQKVNRPDIALLIRQHLATTES